ncbi:hypothetical protein EMIHUDRAFT_202655 [Emiliania huxleyi CCMP1516]|uniref:Uncharacterized protein n=2 Tax=Emiliania huxleyi TaxID=2903 RepID=A0A0D3IY20_EMIH1|nr:hypothetical protein EMIHUDRAFT_245284 [Emiliania huxleyi CCMP1516]XP_005784508.1 hypothetical protein EMIHUDRAFT_202655 [Emiliania huxleyi CCMP1516]EOD16155.1 hypothetical protein EMIHUDRAFT_245284 [Emiliania huxleyi CCMP1516]EOD32079.1 hypothetical protein EMIHUDRAFT_202655 [Emiliania huxleyi CCMP1516]|eukprot:XP_005768584.1 hypothetical protein EMIHUDRAFT_245284 [Emiliania huxleyi CCMP1516]
MSPLVTRSAALLLLITCKPCPSLRVGTPISRPFVGVRSSPQLSDAGCVNLEEAGGGRVLPCFVAGTVDVEGTTYAALYPANAPATLATQSEGTLEPLDPAFETTLLPAAKAACRAVGAELHDTPVVLTASGEAVERDYELIEDAAPSFDGSDDEDMVVLADFVHEGKTIFVLRMLDPVYVVGRCGPDGSYTVPSDEEMESVGDVVEDLVGEIEDALDAEEDMAEDAPDTLAP